MQQQSLIFQQHSENIQYYYFYANENKKASLYRKPQELVILK